ncbi:MAG: alpha/beta fold hydrolase, partial [Gaiellales bacterium]
YVEAFREPAMIHATCEDYRAGATIDLEHDRARLDRRITCPLLVVWGRRTKPGDLTEVWRRRASDVRGVGLPGGHFIAEELPEETAAALLEFLEH